MRDRDQPRGHVHGRQPAIDANPRRAPAGAGPAHPGVLSAGEIERLNQTIGLQRTNLLIQRTRAGEIPLVQRDPIAPRLPRGTRTREFSVRQYIAMWERKHGRRMTASERADLARGCIGITNLNLNSGSVDPPLEMSFDTFAQARRVARELNAILRARMSVTRFEQLVQGHPLLSRLHNVVSSLPSGSPGQWRAVVFSKRFYSNQAANWNARRTPRPGAFQPDPGTGQVDMSSYEYRGRPDPSSGRGAEFVNFDYGWYDEETNSWWHANHAQPGMKVYQSTLAYYSRPLLDFDKQVFCVAFARK